MGLLWIPINLIQEPNGWNDFICINFPGEEKHLNSILLQETAVLVNESSITNNLGGRECREETEAGN